MASIGLDPGWEDGGRDALSPGRWRSRSDAYWRESGHGPLEGMATVRRDLLARLLPGLQNSGSFSLEGMHVRVQGKLNAYLIHIGCASTCIADRPKHVSIVAGCAKPRAPLPFDDDPVLSLVLSKAFLVLRDDRIKDPAIRQQII